MQLFFLSTIKKYLFCKLKYFFLIIFTKHMLSSFSLNLYYQYVFSFGLIYKHKVRKFWFNFFFRFKNILFNLLFIVLIFLSFNHHNFYHDQLFKYSFLRKYNLKKKFNVNIILLIVIVTNLKLKLIFRYKFMKK